jgi:hypothetical protein
MRHPALITVCAIIAAVTGSVNAAVSIDYTPTVLPNSASPYSFTWIVFGGTSGSVANDVLTMTTAYQRGIWFGHNGTGGVNWSIAPNNQGNYLKVDAKLGAGADEWSIYLGDGSRGAAFTLYHDHLLYYTFDGVATVEHTLGIDLTDDFHTFEFLVKDNAVSYALDGDVLAYNALAMPYGSILVIGDGSGPTIGGTGSMYVSGVEYVGDPQFTFIPEPAGLAGLLAAGGLIVRRRR